MTPKLYMLLLGATPKDRFIEQHDVFFTIGTSLKELVPHIRQFWPTDKIHIDSWREVNVVDGYRVNVVPSNSNNNSVKLFFLNLGGYKKNEFEEFHYKMLLAATDKASAIKAAKQTAFYKHTSFKGAESHIDDKYGVDVDDIFEIADILPDEIRKEYSLQITPTPDAVEDEIHLGYFKLDKL